MTRAMIMSLAAAAMASTALHAPAAEAKGKMVEMHKFHKVHFYKWYPHYHFVTLGPDCSFFYWKWKHTGSLYWKSKYFVCTGIY